MKLTPLKDRAAQRSGLAFTLLELLTVLAIIGIITAIALPTIQSFRPDPTAVAGRQILDAVSRARQLAISQRTTVYLVFVPTNFWNDPSYNKNWTAQDLRRASNLFDKQLIGYNFVSLRSLGDQPGRPTAHYLSSWRTLPDGAFIPLEKFFRRDLTKPVLTIVTNDSGGVQRTAFRVLGFNTTTNIPFPYETTAPANSTRPYIALPFLSFNYLGQLENGQNDLIPIAKGSVNFQRDPAIGVGAPVNPSITYAAPREQPTPTGLMTNTSFQVVNIDWLTGRARLEHMEVR